MENPILKNGETVVIRPGRPEDAEQYVSYIDMIAGESDNLTFGQGEFNVTIEQQEKVIEAFLLADSEPFFTG